MPDRKLRVFLCHASQDKSVVRELYQRLHAEDWIDPWLDEEKLLPGQDWDMEIEKAVEHSDAVIVLLSSNSVSKEGYVQRELRYVIDVALEKPEGTIFIIPLRIDDCQIPRKLKSIHYIDYFPSIHRNRFFNRLLESLRNRRGSETPTHGIDDQHVAVGRDPYPASDLNRTVHYSTRPKKVFASLPRILGLLGSLLVFFRTYLKNGKLRSKLESGADRWISKTNNGQWLSRYFRK